MPGHLGADRAHSQAGTYELLCSHLSQKAPELMSNTAGGLRAGRFIVEPTTRTSTATQIVTSEEPTCCLFPGTGVQQPAPRHPPHSSVH